MEYNVLGIEEYKLDNLLDRMGYIIDEGGVSVEVAKSLLLELVDEEEDSKINSKIYDFLSFI